MQEANHNAVLPQLLTWKNPGWALKSWFKVSRYLPSLLPPTA